MSIIVPPVPPIDADTSFQPEAGEIVGAQSGDNFVITDPATNAENPAIIATSGGTNEVAAGAQQSNVFITGDGDFVDITTAVAANGGLLEPLDGSGSTFQVDEDFEGTVIADLDGAIIGNAKVDLDTETQNGSIADNAPAGADGIDYYVNGGAGNDQLGGSAGNDFIRGGAGDDSINAKAGNDIVRPGAGTDDITLGTGEDVLYLTVDQLQGVYTNTITDFTSGEDTIQIDADLESRSELNFVDGDLIIELTGTETGSTTISSNNNDIGEDDVEFV